LNIDDNDMVVTDVMQKTLVEVNEEGTEVAAVTKVAILTGAITSVEVPKESIRFFCDRPFLFLIRERSTGVILFIVRIDNPREWK